MSRNAVFRAGIAVLAAFMLIALAAPLIAPSGPTAITGPPLRSPDPLHWLGTNELGQDVFSQLIWGARITLLFGLCSAAFSVTVSTLVAIMTGYYGGIADEIVCRAIDVFLPIPSYVLLLVFTTFFSPDILQVCVLMGLLYSVHGTRVIRSQVLPVASMNYIEGAKAIGASDLRIMFRHILPNVMPIVIVKFVSVSRRLLVIGVGLSFIGMWDTTTVDWGTMIQSAYSQGGVALCLWWWLLPPGIAVVILSLSLSLIGYSLEEEFNPRVGVNRI